MMGSFGRTGSYHESLSHRGNNIDNQRCDVVLQDAARIGIIVSMCGLDQVFDEIKQPTVQISVNLNEFFRDMVLVYLW